MIVFNSLGHLIIALITALLIAHNPIAFVAVIIGGLLPDIDIRGSMLGKYNPFVKFMKHRGHCHSLIGISILSLPFLFIGLTVFIYGVIGGISHILGDRFLSIFPNKKKFRLKIW